MRLALVSLDQVWEDKQSNLTLCEEYIRKASNEKVDLIVFPEMTLTGFSNNINLTAEHKEDSTTIKLFSELSEKYSLAIVFGVVIQDGKKALNKSILIDTSGKVGGEYSKVHPFSFAGEDKYFNSGHQLCIVNFNHMKIGLSICYDLRFPELYSALAEKSDLVVNIANWPAKRIDHWNTLLKARAIENQVYMAGVNRVGKDANGLEYIESSSLFNANGELLEHKQIDNMKIYEVDKTWTKKFKEQFNTTDDRKIDFYKEIL
ncbi:nitrilase-related carbon-nitrogen hydrolase [Sulfurimonas sp. HSL3-2]|uniref:nitrilase-related carbon-nitrogen hydrolase n=1 Tax=Hydrocurvibacter mobilis TaxID=3131936 RepID=UPI0031F87ECF